MSTTDEGHKRNETREEEDSSEDSSDSPVPTFISHQIMKQELFAYALYEITKNQPGMARSTRRELARQFVWKAFQDMRVH